MSKETSNWLNANILVGNTLRNGNPWWYDANLDANNLQSVLYPEFIPVDDVLSRLFNFDVIEKELHILVNGQMIEVPGRKAMVTSDTADVLGIFSGEAGEDKGYKGHDYRSWLVDNVANILDENIGIGSAGLLKNRAVAWVQVEVPETVNTAQGLSFRPNLLACTSFDGSLATTYKRTVTITVCDNTMSAALSEIGQNFKLKHTRNSVSEDRIRDAREALNIIDSIATDFSSEIKRLAEWEVSQAEFSKLIDLTVPLPSEAGRAMTLAENKRAGLLSMYHEDERVAPWAGTALGVVQLMNTYDTHNATVRNAHRAERNKLDALNGGRFNRDSDTLKRLTLVTGRR